MVRPSPRRTWFFRLKRSAGVANDQAVIGIMDASGAERMYSFMEVRPAGVVGSRDLARVDSLLLGSVSHGPLPRVDLLVTVVPSADFAAARTGGVRAQ